MTLAAKLYGMSNESRCKCHTVQTLRYVSLFKTAQNVSVSMYQCLMSYAFRLGWPDTITNRYSSSQREYCETFA